MAAPPLDSRRAACQTAMAASSNTETASSARRRGEEVVVVVVGLTFPWGAAQHRSTAQLSSFTPAAAAAEAESG
uniref:Uncharacterized protein n=1 Tax=Oryza rufipogon TaxID=4529 RepID=A0A0E0PNI8_ORYRU